ncbi:MAG: hypothetical protein KDC92_03400 [Bacteroidetes bacterium]|nr:hypothetical protein [Bacteroidota bacterium]
MDKGEVYLQEILKVIDYQQNKSYRLLTLSVTILASILTYLVTVENKSEVLAVSACLSVPLLLISLYCCFKSTLAIVIVLPGHEPKKLSQLILPDKSNGWHQKAIYNDLLEKCQKAIEHNERENRKLSKNNSYSIWSLVLLLTTPLISFLFEIFGLI